MATEKDFIVAIELGSSRISGIAGRKKDGTMQILAYAEEMTTACVKRGFVYNIEKTYQSINAIISKLETALKAKVAHVYVGLAGQSVRSYKCIVKRNMVTHSYITNEAISSLREESYRIPYSDCQVFDNIPQEYLVDSNLIGDPVGVMGTNIQGEYVDIIANKRILQSINTVFSNTGVKVADIVVAPCELARQVLTDLEKRSGCALVDLGADTTTVVVYKNNVVRFLTTIPLGMNNINKDLASIDIYETEDVKVNYADACYSDSNVEEDADSKYVLNDGRSIDVSLIKTIIEARINEIIANVNNQLVLSNYSDKLIGGIVLVGGGCGVKNIDKAFLNETKVDKVRIASEVSTSILKASGMGNPTFETSRGLTILSLLLAGKKSCAAEMQVEAQKPAAQVPDLIEQMEQEDERAKRQKELEAQALADAQLAIAFDNIKNKIRQQILAVEKEMENIRISGKDKKVREAAEKVAENALNVINEEFHNDVDVLSSKEKYKLSAADGVKLAEQLRESNTKLREMVVKAKEDNKFFNRLGKIISDIVNE